MKAELYDKIRTAEKIVDQTDQAVRALKDLKSFLQLRREECPEVIKCLNTMVDFRIKKRDEYYNNLLLLDDED